LESEYFVIYTTADFLRTSGMNKFEEEVYKAVRQMLADVESQKTDLKYAVKFMEKALQSTGDELRENCLYILGNSISWTGEDYIRIKKTLRRYAFSPAVRRKKGR
jgi:hypothetical protein